MLLLALVDVPAETIAADYVLSAERLAPTWRDLGLGDQNGHVDAILSRHGTTAHQAVVTALESLDVPAYLRRAGVAVDAVRTRMLGTVHSG